jgi:hypothetical protein
MSDAFERRLAGALQAYADGRTRPVDASVVARAVVARRRSPGWRATPRPFGLGLILAAAAAALLAAGFALGVGSMHRPLAVPPIDSTPPAAPTPASSTLVLPGSAGWQLDWTASGLTSPTFDGQPTVTLTSRLTFGSDTVQLEQAFGAGCDIAVGPYALSGAQLVIKIEDSPSACAAGEASTVKHRLTQTATYSLGREPCTYPPTAPETPLLPSAPGCRTLKLFDTNSKLLLIFRGFDDLPAGLPTPEPVLTRLSANRWQLDWTASGLDGHVITTIAEPMTSLLTFDAAGTFTVWQGYAGGCDTFAGTAQVHGDGFIHLDVDPGPSGCVGAAPAPQAVRDRLGTASGFFLHLAGCSGGELQPGYPGYCLTLQLDDRTGDQSLVYRAVP